MSFLKSFAKSEPYKRVTPITNIVMPSPPQVSRSWTFDKHVTQEASFGGGSNRGKGKMPQAVSLAWDERGSWGVDMAPQSWLGMTTRERKETLLQIYLANPWASSCIDTIGLYIVSGGFVIEPAVENPDKAQYKKIEDFLLRINENWDFCDYVYDAITDLLIFGECFTDFTIYQGMPYELFPTDCITIDTDFDQYGRITRFKQILAHTTQVNYLDPNRMIRWWQPHKRAKVDPISPLEHMQDAIWLDKQMINWQTTFFRKGGKFPYYFKGLADQDEADRYLRWFEQNYTGAKNAHTIPATWGETEIKALGNDGPIDMSFDKGLDRTQSIVLATLHVPPSIACISEVGNRLTDMSDSQRKVLEFITCNPRRKRFFEKFNYRFIYPYFGRDYRVTTRYANFRNDEEVAKVDDMQIKNGSKTIDETRQEAGRKPYEDGSGAVPIIITTREVIPVPRLNDLEEESRQTAQATLDTAKANADLATTKAKQAKEQPNNNDPANKTNQKDKNGQDQEEAERRRQLFEEGQRRGGICIRK